MRLIRIVGSNDGCLLQRGKDDGQSAIFIVKRAQRNSKLNIHKDKLNLKTKTKKKKREEKGKKEI